MPASRRATLLALVIAALTACASGTSGPTANTVLVAGASGQTGQLVVTRLVAEGYRVRAMVRDASRPGVSFPAGVVVVSGDVKEPASLGPALANARYVVSAIGARSGQGPDRPEKIDFEGVRNLAAAARAAQVRQFVLVSSRSVTQDDNPLNKMFGDVLKWKLKGENALRESGVPYTVVRPGGLTNGSGGQRRLVLEQGDTVSAQTTIARADVAELCVQALRYPEAVNRTFEASSVDGAPTADWRALFAALR
jgi:uncharacterized protein YbjT (DUF2867 family)